MKPLNKGLSYAINESSLIVSIRYVDDNKKFPIL